MARPELKDFQVELLAAKDDHVRREIAQRIRQAISKAGWSQRSMAQELGVTPSTLTRWVKGENQPPLETLRRLCIITEIDANEILALSLPLGDAVAAALGAKHMATEQLEKELLVLIQKAREYAERVRKDNETVRRAINRAVKKNPPPGRR